MTRAPGVLLFADLQAATGFDRRADVERYLRKSRIRFFPARDGVWTTIDLVNAAGGIKSAANDERIEDLL